MSASDQLFWSLPQAAAWVVFRDMAVVDRFSPPTPNDWGAFMMYPTMRLEYEEHGRASDLFDAICVGRLIAFGRHNTEGSVVKEIPTIEWHDLVPDMKGPYRNLHTGERDIPWLEIRVRRADVEKLWRRLSETQARSRHPSSWFQQRYAKLRAQHPDLSQNELILELQGEFQEEMGREPPSRSSIQRYIKAL